MSIITIDTERVLDMVVTNADRHQNSICGDDGQIIIDTLAHVYYEYPNPGTYYQNCHNIDPVDFFNIDAIEKNYSLDIASFQTDARDIVSEENNKSEGDEFTDAEEDKISEYVNSYISEWKEFARLDKKNVLQVEDAEGKIVDEYKITWV